MTIAVLPEEGKIRDFQNNIKSVANRNKNVSFSLKCKKIVICIISYSYSYSRIRDFFVFCVWVIHIVNILNTKCTEYVCSNLTGLLSHSSLNAHQFLVQTSDRGMMMTLSFVQKIYSWWSSIFYDNRNT